MTKDPFPDLPKLTLPDGSVVYIADLVDYETYATLELHPGHVLQHWDVFDQARGFPIPSSPTNRRATDADSNLTRPGTSGLPMNWAGLIFGWRASVDGAKVDVEGDALARWLAATGAALVYREKIYARLPVSELVRAPAPVIDPEGRVFIDADGKIRNEGHPKTSDLQPGHIMIPVHLQEDLSFGVRLDLNDATARIATELHEPVLVRFYLRGYWKRPVV